MKRADRTASESAWRASWDHGGARHDVRGFGGFDEFVLSGVFHIEDMGSGLWDVHIGPMHLWVTVKKGAVVRIVQCDAESGIAVDWSRTKRRAARRVRR